MQCRIFTDPSNGATYPELLDSARSAEEFGYSGFFLSDHYFPFAGDGGSGPTDLWTTLAGLARETSHLRLGSLVTSVTFRNPGPLAIVVAQVHAMSDGRIEFGLGAGYFEPEHLACGIPFPSSASGLTAWARRWNSSRVCGEPLPGNANLSPDGVSDCAMHQRCQNQSKPPVRQSFSVGSAGNAHLHWRCGSPTNSTCRPAAVSRPATSTRANSQARTSSGRSSWFGRPPRRSAGRSSMRWAATPNSASPGCTCARRRI